MAPHLGQLCLAHENERNEGHLSDEQVFPPSGYYTRDHRYVIYEPQYRSDMLLSSQF